MGGIKKTQLCVDGLII